MPLVSPHRPDQADGQGRPGLRLAAWRAVWGAQRADPVYRARYQHLTTREHNKLTPTQALREHLGGTIPRKEARV
jgi:hypothetical protein